MSSMSADAGPATCPGASSGVAVDAIGETVLPDLVGCSEAKNEMFNWLGDASVSHTPVAVLAVLVGLGPWPTMTDCAARPTRAASSTTTTAPPARRRCSPEL